MNFISIYTSSFFFRSYILLSFIFALEGDYVASENQVNWIPLFSVKVSSCGMARTDDSGHYSRMVAEISNTTDAIYISNHISSSSLKVENKEIYVRMIDRPDPARTYHIFSKDIFIFLA